MWKFLAFVLALGLGFLGAIGLSHVPRGLTASFNGEMGRAGNLTSVAPTNSKAVEAGGIRFEILVPDLVWLIPENRPNAETSVQIGIRITNNTSTPLRFTRYNTLYPEIVRPDGQVLQSGKNGESPFKVRASDCPLVQSGESVTFFVNGSLSWKDNQLQLNVFDGFGYSWQFHPLAPGMNQVRFRYQSDSAAISIHDPKRMLLEGIWTGQVITPLVEIPLVRR